ncbi:hypothetical protein Goarm_022662, partial [Gossypium armourianum]|nr:hypothetical protein [Gossypium armourianum]
MDLDSSPNDSKWEEKLYRAKLDKEIMIEKQNSHQMSVLNTV